MIRLISFILLFSPLTLSSQIIHRNWIKGEVKLESGPLLQGEIKYHQETDVLQFRSNPEEPTDSYSPYQAIYFLYFDDKMDLTRYFASVYVPKSPFREDRVFLEVVLKGGKISLFRREKRFKFQKQTPFDRYRTILYDFVDYYDYAYTDGELIEYKNFKKQVMPLMADFRKELRSFIKEKRLNLDEPLSQIMLVDYYNQLSDPDYLLINTEQK